MRYITVQHGSAKKAVHLSLESAELGVILTKTNVWNVFSSSWHLPYNATLMCPRYVILQPTFVLSCSLSLWHSHQRQHIHDRSRSAPALDRGPHYISCSCMSRAVTSSLVHRTGRCQANRRPPGRWIGNRVIVTAWMNNNGLAFHRSCCWYINLFGVVTDFWKSEIPICLRNNCAQTCMWHWLPPSWTDIELDSTW